MRRNAAHVAADGFDDHCCDLVPVGLESGFDGGGIVEGNGQRGVAEAFRNAGGIGEPERGDARTGLHEKGIDMAVIAAFELDGQVAAGESPGYAQRAHGGFRAGIDQPDHLDGGNHLPHGFGEFDLLFGGRAEAGAARDGEVQGVEDDGMPVTQNQRSPGADVIDIFVAVGIENVGALAALDEGRSAAYAAIGADRGVDAARYGEQGAFEKLLGSGYVPPC